MSASINSLPIETITNILGKLNTQTLKSVRLVNSFLAAIGATLLLPQVTFFHTIASIERLKDISLHPVFSQYVETLLYDGSRFAEWFDREEDWEGHDVEEPSIDYIDSGGQVLVSEAVRADSHSNPHKFSDMQAEANYQVYRHQVAEQIEICSRDLDKRAIVDAIIRMPRLSNVCINFNEGIAPYSSDYLPWVASILSGYAGERNRSSYGGGRQLSTVLLAFGMPERYHISNHAAHKLHLNSNPVAWLQHLAVAELSQRTLVLLDSILDQIGIGLAQLRYLYLGFKDYFVDDEGRSMKACTRLLKDRGVLRKFVAMCPELRSLRLDFGLATEDGHCATMSTTVGDMTWPHLECLSLGSIRARDTELLNVFARHFNTLKEVHMKNMMLTRNEDWEDLITGARELKISHLKTFWVYVDSSREENENTVEIKAIKQTFGRHADASRVMQIDRYVRGVCDFNPLRGVTFDEKGRLVWPANPEANMSGQGCAES